jgi:hypothetical protein
VPLLKRGRNGWTVRSLFWVSGRSLWVFSFHTNVASVFGIGERDCVKFFTLGLTHGPVYDGPRTQLYAVCPRCPSVFLNRSAADLSVRQETDRLPDKCGARWPPLLWSETVYTKTIFIFIFFFSKTRSKTITPENKNDIGNLKTSETKFLYENYTGYDRNLNFDR